MKIVICLGENIYSAKSLNLLLPYLKNHQVKILLYKSGSFINLPNSLKKMKEFEQGRMLELFANLDDTGFVNHKKFLTFTQIAQILKTEIVSYIDINSAIATQELREFSPDLMISIRFGQIFKDEIITIPKYGIINLHSGKLPQFRGVIPSFWSVLKGENIIGATLHYIDSPQIDVGDIINSTRLAINWERSLVHNIYQLYDEGCELILDCIKKIESGIKIKTTKQNEIGIGNYFSYPKEEQVVEVMKKICLFEEKDKEIFWQWQD